MRTLLSLAFSFCGFICLAQDGDHQDYRRKTESFERIYDKEIRGDLASFSIGGIAESLGKSPLKKLDLGNFDSTTLQFTGNKLVVTTIKEVTVITGADTVRVPQNALFDLYNPVFNSADAVYISADNRKLYIYMLNQDSTGSYEVTWVMQDKTYLRRILDFGFSKP